MRYGNFDVSIITILSWFDNKWASEPYDWTGVHKILDMIPAYSIIPVTFVLAIFFWLNDIYDEYVMTAEEMEDAKGDGDK